MFQDAIDALRRNAPEAVALALAEVEATPGNAEVHHVLGLALRGAGEMDAARASLDRAIELAPNEAIYQFSRASLARAMGDLASADQASARAIVLDPNYFEAYVLRIQLALAAGDSGEAERQLELAERADRNRPDLMYLAGQVALLKGDGARALKLLDQARTDQPGNAQVLATLGAAYQQQGHFAFAEQSLRRALELDPARTGWRLPLAETLLAQEKFEQAEAEATVYRQHHPQDPRGMVMQGELRMRAGKPAAAITDFRAALSVAAYDAGALKGLQDALIAIGDRAMARGAWEGVLQNAPGADPIWMSRLYVSDTEEDYDHVLRRWREAMPDSIAARLHQARRDDFQGRDAVAEAGYDAVLEQAPGQLDALTGRAAITFRNSPAQSLERWNALIAQAPPPLAVAALAMRGRSHDRLEHVHDAVADWLEADTKGIGTVPSPIPLPSEATAILVADLPPAADETQVVMLWGPPGSGSERIADSLRQATSRPLLQAVQNVPPRTPQYSDGFIASALDPDQLPTVVNEFAPVYSRLLEPFLAQGQSGIFDWLTQWDARVVPALRHALPGMRLLAVLRDPRDLLLNWLAFGAPDGAKFDNATTAAAWLKNQLDHLLFSRDVWHLPVLIVDMDRFDADPSPVMREVGEFAGLKDAPDPQPALQRREDAWRMPSLLPAGRWRAYRTDLGEAFELLAPLAEKLGYPLA